MLSNGRARFTQVDCFATVTAATVDRFRTISEAAFAGNGGPDDDPAVPGSPSLTPAQSRRYTIDTHTTDAW